MNTVITVVYIIGIVFSWWVIWFYKKHWAWYFIMIPIAWVGFIGFLMFSIEKSVDLYKYLKNKEDEI